MKKISWILLLTGLFFYSGFGKSFQSDDTAGLSGVNFEKLNFKETLSKAQKEKKMVLVDAYSNN